MRPEIHFIEPPRPAQKLKKMEHKRWKSEPVKKGDMVQPFSYEYKLEDGRVLGLVEHHPRNSAAWPPRAERKKPKLQASNENLSVLSVAEHSVSSLDEVVQSAVQSPPPSPRKGEALRRALTLHGMKKRSSSEARNTPPASPYSPRPEVEKLAATFGPNGPQHITYPIPQPPPERPHGMFEMPRAAPRPPSRDKTFASPRLDVSPLPLSPLPSQSFFAENAPALRPSNSRHALKSNSSHNAVLPPQKGSLSPQLPNESSKVPSDILTPPHSPIEDQLPTQGIRQTEQGSQPSASTKDVEKSLKRPPALRRKNSKFVEHIERTEKLSPRLRDRIAEEIPPVPPMVMRASELHLSARELSPLLSPAKEVTISPNIQPKVLPDSPIVGYVPHLPWDSEERSSERTGPSEEHAKFAQPANQNPGITRSSSVMKSLPPTPFQILGRSKTTITRPPPAMADVRMAEVKPVLTSGVIAQGHARMISC